MALATIQRYDPRARSTPQKQYTNRDAPGGGTIDYGQGPPGRNPNYHPNVSPSYPDGPPGADIPPQLAAQFGFGPTMQHMKGNPTPEEAAAYAANQSQVGDRWGQIFADPTFQQQAPGIQQAVQQMGAAGGGNPTQLWAQQRAMMNQVGQNQGWRPTAAQQAQAWPTPSAPSGNYQYGPGRPGPTPPGVPGGGGGGGAQPPSFPPPGGGGGPPTGAYPGGPGGGFPGGGFPGASTQMDPRLMMAMQQRFGFAGGGMGGGASTGQTNASPYGAGPGFQNFAPQMLGSGTTGGPAPMGIGQMTNQFNAQMGPMQYGGGGGMGGGGFDPRMMAAMQRQMGQGMPYNAQAQSPMMSADIQRKLADGMSPRLLGLA